MSLVAGARLGAYQVIAPIGAGGMGEVYKARDTRLDRDVAIKVLPAHLASDEAARSRFEREAKAIASLSHPNILAVYDVGTFDQTAFVVMELLEGETLRERLGSTPLTAGSLTPMPMRKVVQIGVDIAHGLAAAHDRQIVHRDIKPENIFLAADGHVKILDFGLAKAVDSGGASASSHAATELQQTDPGTVMGTVGYMAPEQVKGQAVDHRADIFSLGCVLYEMASGRRPFVRESAAETLSAILRDEPPDLVSGSGAITASFEPIVRHCLEKRAEERFQSARDLAFALQSMITSSGTATASPVAVPAQRRRGWLIPGMGAAGLIVAAFVAGRALGTSAANVDGGSGSQVERFQQLTDVAGVETQPTLSPDGKTLVYVSAASGALQIHSQRIGSRASTPLTSGASNTHPAFSPDGERIAFRSERDGGGVFLMSATGESVTRVSDEGYSPSWSPGGDEVVVTRANFVSPTDLASNVPGLLVIDIKSSKKREVRTIGAALQPAWSPHGFRIAYFSLRPGSGQRDLFTVAADGSSADAPIGVTNDAPLDWSPAWSPSGDALYFSSNRGGTMNLWRVAIDERTGKVLGEPAPVTTPSNWSGMMSFSRDGLTMAFASLDWRSTLLRQGFDPTREITAGPPSPLLRGSRPIRDHDISPDGQWIAFNETGAREDLFVARIDGTEYRRLTDDAARDRGPAWTRDGQRIVFYSDRGGSYDLWSIRPDGSHLEQMTSGSNANFPIMSPDGARIAFSGTSAKGLMIIPATPGVAPIKDLKTEPPMGDELVFWPASWSAAGELIGFGNAAPGRIAGYSIYDTNARTYRPVEGTAEPAFSWQVWLKDSRRFLARTAEGISIYSAATGTRKMLTPVRGYSIGRCLYVAPDNTWYSYTETGTEGDIWLALLKGK